MTNKEKNPAAQTLGKLSVKKRFKGKSKKERSEIMRQVRLSNVK